MLNLSILGLGKMLNKMLIPELKKILEVQATQPLIDLLEDFK
jgi:hypothetical protein